MSIRTSGHACSVLVVDNEVALREQTCRWVEALGYRVREAATATRALIALSEDACDIAVCDVRLGGGQRHGLWLASLLAEVPKGRLDGLIRELDDLKNAVKRATEQARA